MSMRSRFFTLVVVIAGAAATVAPTAAQEPLPPDPAIAQYVETMPTTRGAKAGSSEGGGERALSDAELASAAESAVPMQVVWLGVVLAGLTAAAVALTATRRRRRT